MIKPAIVIVTYNRPDSLKRLLNSVLSAYYSAYRDIPLIISIDGGGNKDVAAVAEAVDWKYGQKEVIKYPANMGLRRHIISCGDLSHKYGSVIILEDDCFVSRNYYDFAFKALNFYSEDKRIAGISLYSYKYNENALLPFCALNDSNDVFFMQVPSSLGQVWTKKQWKRFKEYYKMKPIISEVDKLPEKVKNWPESSWKKYFYKYILENKLYFVYPSISYATNFGNIGTHTSNEISTWQVPLELGSKNNSFNFVTFDESYNKYDCYFELLTDCLRYYGVEVNNNCCIDLYGTKQFELFDCEYALSLKKCKNSIRSYGGVLFPFVQNLIYEIQGEIFSYAKKGIFERLKWDDRLSIIKNVQPFGFNYGAASVLETRCYKLGYYILNPQKILSMIKRKIIKT